MCDLAILVVDIMHGLEPQTLESLGLLRKGNTPFVVALNKIDRLFDWRRMPTSSVKEAVKKQNKNTKDEFDERVKGVVTEFAEQVWSQFSNKFFSYTSPKSSPFLFSYQLMQEPQLFHLFCHSRTLFLWGHNVILPRSI